VSGVLHSIASIFRPASTAAESIYGLAMLVLLVCLAIFIQPRTSCLGC
jgi:hypothetical protein